MWEMGRTWGFRLYVTGRDPGTEFTIQCMEEIREEVPIGPNAYNPYQIPPDPFAPGGPKIKEITVPLPKLLLLRDLHREAYLGQ
jgi:hypothetical protein